MRGWLVCATFFGHFLSERRFSFLSLLVHQSRVTLTGSR